MSDTVSETSRLREARERAGLSRELVVRQLHPPISSKTLERWEALGYQPQRQVDKRRWYLTQLASIYQVRVEDIEPERAAA